MMEIEKLEQGVQDNLSALEGFLKTIMLKKLRAELSASSEADEAMVAEALKTGTVVIQCHEQNFGTDIFIAFDENWIPQLSMAMLGVEEQEVNEITRDLITEFSQQLLGTAQMTLQEQGIPIEPGEVTLLKSGQISNAVEEGDYFMAQIDVSGKFEIEGDEQPQLALIITYQIPDDDTIQAVMGSDEDDVTEEVEGAVEDTVEAPDQSGEGGEPVPVGAGEELQSERAQAKPEVKGRHVDFEEFSPSMTAESEVEVRNLDLLKDVELDISVELGRKEVPLGDILHLVRGSVIELDKLAGEPVEVYANGHRIAEGEVVVIDEHFGVRVTNLVSTRERIESLR
jgi:flagellar motor switch protein FliN/FliY